MGRIGGTELLIILMIVLMLFGARKLTDLARSLGASAKEFRRGIEKGAEDAEASKSDAAETSDS